MKLDFYLNVDVKDPFILHKILWADEGKFDKDSIKITTERH